MIESSLSAKIESLFQKNEYNEIEKILKKQAESSKKIIFRIRLLRATAKYDEAMKQIEQFLNNLELSSSDKAEALIEKAHCYWYLDHKDSLNLVLDSVESLINNFVEDSNITKHIKANYLHLRAIGAKNFATTSTTIQLLNESIMLKQEINAEGDLALSYNNLGYYYWIQNEFEQAILNLEKSLEINKSIENEEQAALNLINLIQVSVAMDEIDKGNEFLSSLEELYLRNIDNKLVQTYFKYAKGLMLTQSTNLRYKLEAEDIFEEIVNSDFVISSFYIKSIFNICNLLFYQLKISYDEPLFDKLIDKITLLYNFGMDTKMGLTILKAEFLQAKILAFKGNFVNAKNLLLKLSDDAIHLGDIQISNLVAMELAMILEREKLEQTAKNLKFALQESDMDELLANFITNRNPKIPVHNETPISLIVLRTDGNQLYATHFDDDVQFNSFLVSSFISAVNSFANQIFGLEHGGLDKIKHQDYNILLRKKGNNMYCYIYKGESHMSVVRLTSIIDEICSIIDEIGEIIVIGHETKILLDSKVMPILQFNN